MPVESATLASTILTELGESFPLPDVTLTGAEYTLPSQVGNVLYGDIAKIEVSDLTTGVVGGTGAFDQMMASHKAHLEEQFKLRRITAEQYTKAYIELTTAALGASVQMVLGREQAYWAAALAQAQARRAEIEAVTAAVGLATAKAALATATTQAKIAESQAVLIKMQIAGEDAKYRLTEEQLEAKRAETLDTRTDGALVKGTIGKQKDLYTQQIDSYKKDATYKVGKLYSDSWIAQKTIDESLLAPENFTNASINAVLRDMRAGVNL